MRTFIAAALAAAVVVGSALPAAAGSWTFGLLNQTNEVITGFRTQEGGAWSGNWLKQQVKPGDEFEMDFGTAEGECVVRSQVTFADGSYFDYDVDYCQVNNLYVYADEIRWD
ncbi:hypothetical protein [Caenispirillum bisanense]|uniref:hypothetical protein n=1 Tax=Caenispirillum bisanense TaxID=414052 RepID=UPI0031E0E242